jgi:transcriptional regulator with XRE-family HTH domain
VVKTANPPKNLIALAFREARRRLGLTQEQVASHGGIGISALSQFERGGIGLTGEVCDKIADRLNGAYRAIQREAREIVKRGEVLPIHLLAFGFNDPEILNDDSSFVNKVALQIVEDEGMDELLQRTKESGKRKELGQLGRYAALSLIQSDLSPERAEIEVRAQLEQGRAQLEELIRADRQRRADEIKRRRWIARLEKLRSKVDDPVLSEVIQSFRREIDRLEEQVTTLKKKKR